MNETNTSKLIAQTTLPTEVGTYLFIGYSDKSAPFEHLREAEYLRVFRGAGDKLHYVGADFWWHPERAVGTWLRIDIDPEVVVDAKLRAARAVFEARDKSRARWYWGRGEWETLLGKDAMEIAVEQGWIVEDNISWKVT